MNGPITLGHTYVLGLPTRHTAIQMAIAEQCSPRRDGFLVKNRPPATIGGFAGSERLHLAEKAAAAGNNERNHHTITRLDGRHLRADFFDDAHEFVTKNIALLCGGDLASIQMQVRATNSGRRDLQQDVIRFLDDRVGDSFHTHIVGAVISQCTHEDLLSRRRNRKGRRLLKRH